MGRRVHGVIWSGLEAIGKGSCGFKGVVGEIIGVWETWKFELRMELSGHMAVVKSC